MLKLYNVLSLERGRLRVLNKYAIWNIVQDIWNNYLIVTLYHHLYLQLISREKLQKKQG